MEGKAIDLRRAEAQRCFLGIPANASTLCVSNQVAALSPVAYRVHAVFGWERLDLGNE